MMPWELEEKLERQQNKVFEKLDGEVIFSNGREVDVDL